MDGYLEKRGLWKNISEKEYCCWIFQTMNIINSYFRKKKVMD